MVWLNEKEKNIMRLYIGVYFLKILLSAFWKA